MRNYVFRIARSAAAGVTQPLTVALEPPMTVLDAPFLTQRKQDPGLAFRCSCRVGMCGTCAVSVNWMPRLACQTRVETLKSDTVHVAPLANLPVIKDLVVSMEPFFEKWRKVRPALHPAKKDVRE